MRSPPSSTPTMRSTRSAKREETRRSTQTSERMDMEAATAGTTSSQIMICPASGAAAFANVQRTIANGVSWASLAPALAPDSADALQPLVDDSGDLRFWGFRENSRDHRAIEPKPP